MRDFKFCSVQFFVSLPSTGGGKQASEVCSCKNWKKSRSLQKERRATCSRPSCETTSRAGVGLSNSQTCSLTFFLIFHSTRPLSAFASHVYFVCFSSFTPLLASCSSVCDFSRGANAFLFSFRGKCSTEHALVAQVGTPRLGKIHHCNANQKTIKPSKNNKSMPEVLPSSSSKRSSVERPCLPSGSEVLSFMQTVPLGFSGRKSLLKTKAHTSPCLVFSSAFYTFLHLSCRNFVKRRLPKNGT